MPKEGITPRAQDYSQWYLDIVQQAQLADYAEVVRGCIVFKPTGYAIWEHMQRGLDDRIKATGHENAYFPLLIPKSFILKEAEHVEGFAPELIEVTRIGKEELAEPYVVRPTSETIIGYFYAKWIRSYRDLPLLINQWANVMRWEMRPRLFLRTAEFLWQEGHTAHETAEEAMEEARTMHRVYADFLRNHLAIPAIPGEKTERERFPGAVNTFTIEAMVQDRKAIQAGTSHFLGQNFAKASGIQFLGRDNQRQHAWTTSWGVSTRLIGTLIMAHADDDGVIVPPRVAPHQIVILPVTPKPDTRQEVIDACEALAQTLKTHVFGGETLRVHVDKRDLQGGAKNWEWIKKGVPLRVEMGPRDITSRNVAVSRRDLGPKAKEIVGKEEFLRNVTDMLEEIQANLLARATALRDEHTKKLDTLDEFKAFFGAAEEEKGVTSGGFALVHWAGSNEDEDKLAKEFKTTIRCIPHGDEYAEEGKCFLTGKPSSRRVVFAKSY